MADPVVVEVLVADGEALADVVRDRGLGGGHTERAEDATADDLGVRSAVDRLEHQAERLVADVREWNRSPGADAAGRSRSDQTWKAASGVASIPATMPAVCDSRCAMVIGDAPAGWGTSNHGRYSVTGASRLSAPSSASSSTATAVKVFPIEPISKSVSGMTGMRDSSLGVAVRPEGERAVGVRDGERETWLCAALDRGEHGHVHGFDEARLRHAPIVLPPVTLGCARPRLRAEPPNGGCNPHRTSRQ